MKELFDELNKLCETNEAFYFAEQDYGEYHVVRSFTYRLASWTDFQEPYAKDSRGTAFVLDKRTGEWSLFCRAYRKFHNLGEGISRDDFMKDNEPVVSYEKMDGSLILVGMIDGVLVAKSKTSLNSEQAQLAQELINKSIELQTFCRTSVELGDTPVFELIGRENVIVLRYQVDKQLVFLGAVDFENGWVTTIQDDNGVQDLMNQGITCATPHKLEWSELLHIQETSKPDIEGYIVDTPRGLVKVKVQSYVDLHRLKESIGNLKNLIGIILSDDVDDLIGSFQDDQETIDYIVDVQEKVGHQFNHSVVAFKELRRKYFQDFNEVRKDFAIKHSKDELFSGVMKTLNVSFKDVDNAAEEQVRLYITKRCSSLGDAKKWVESL